ncbi:hypothetical protein F4780DRAFT_760866 [Xylariomycetidae sp. FL0641]|nr:hypothetical protein F4780DRAFT_760866 [Xylariomycetidae sp. FL0641]
MSQAEACPRESSPFTPHSPQTHASYPSRVDGDPANLLLGLSLDSRSLRGQPQPHSTNEHQIAGQLPERPSSILNPGHEGERPIGVDFTWDGLHSHARDSALTALLIAQDSISGQGPHGIPFDHDYPSPSDIVTDAGDQQFKQLRQTTDSEHSPSSVFSPFSESSSSHIEPEVLQDGQNGSSVESRRPLGSQLIIASVETCEGGQTRRFLPKSELDRLISPTSVSRELRRKIPTASTDDLMSLAQEICQETLVLRGEKLKYKSFRKIFAILVLLDESASISLLLKEDVSDLDLPLVIENYMLRRREPSSVESSKPLECFADWYLPKHTFFAQEQWSMLAPFFAQRRHRSASHYVLDDAHILPFTNKEEDQMDYVGGFGHVKVVDIHQDHHNFHDDKHNASRFAIKKLMTTGKEVFDNEVRMLEWFRGKNSHQHIVTLLATYEQHNHYNLIFYQAESDLLIFWKETKPMPTVDYRTMCWVAKQCAGIADGLCKLHCHLSFGPSSTSYSWEVEDDPKESMGYNVSQSKRVAFASASNSTNAREKSTAQTRGAMTEKFGRHGDIKPENILVYKDPTDEDGILKISDFGASQMNSRLSRSKQQSQLAFSLTWRAPEIDVEDSVMRRSMDIWSLGGVYMSFVTWLLGGYPLIEMFSMLRAAEDSGQQGYTSTKDTFFEASVVGGKTHVKVKKYVTLFFDVLHCLDDCTDYLHELLDNIQHNMLIVESDDAKNFTRRWSSEELRDCLETMLERCRKEEEYATKKTPWRRQSLNGDGKALLEEIDKLLGIKDSGFLNSKI